MVCCWRVCLTVALSSDPPAQTRRWLPSSGTRADADTRAVFAASDPCSSDGARLLTTLGGLTLRDTPAGGSSCSFTGRNGAVLDVAHPVRAVWPSGPHAPR